MVNSKKDDVYLKIGMALISAQRVEYITSKLLEVLIEFDELYADVTTEEFLSQSQKSKKAIKTLGRIFTLLKLNPKLVIEEELTSYLKKRNFLVHNLWQEYLKKGASGLKAIDFCNEFGMHSNRVEKFFSGFIYFLSLKSIHNLKNDLNPELEKLRNDFSYFLKSIESNKLN